MELEVFYMFYDYWYLLFYAIALVCVYPAWLSLKDYKRQKERINHFVGRCISCKAEVIRPVVMEFNYRDLVKSGTEVMAQMAGLPLNLSPTKDTVNTLVRYTVNGKTIETMIKRRSDIRHPKIGAEIDIFYDPELPQHAFAEDMRKQLLLNPLKECVGGVCGILFGIVAGLLYQISM